MKNKKLLLKHTVKAIALCLLFSHSLGMAAPSSAPSARSVEADNNNPAYQQILSLIKDNKLKEAKDLANKQIAANDKAIRAYLVLADIANREKNLKEMERVLVVGLNKAKGSEQAEIEVFKVLGQVYAATKRPAQILPIAENIVSRYPNNGMAVNLLAQSQIINNNKPGAEKTLSKFIAKAPQDVNSRLLLAKLLIEQPNKKAEVMKLLDEAAKLSPNSPDALAMKTAYLMKLKSNPEALELADKLDKQFPDSTIGKQLKAEVYVADQKLAEATEIYQQLFAAQPNDKNLSALASLLVAQKQFPEAIALLEKELAKNPKNLSLHLNLANLYAQTNDLKQAETHYKDVLAAEADNLFALNNLAVIYAKNQDPQALTLAKKAYDKAPNQITVADTYGYILVRLGDAKQGLALLEKVAAAAPKAIDAQFHLAVGYAKTDNKKKAIDILESITKSDQSFAEKEEAVNLLAELKK